MFVSETHLPQLLPPAAYHDPAWHDREVERALLPAWWAVALTDELPRAGSFVTFDHVGGPVILRRGSDGEIRGYRNVCAHRLAKLTGKPHGCCTALTCEYHGWEYDDSGATRRIPDAPSFRPLEKGRLGLDVLRVETVGKVVFLSFATAGLSAREWLGGEADRIATDFDEATTIAWREDVELPVNWKLVVENNLESYHVGTVHARSLGSFPEEAACEHGLFPGGSRFAAPGDPTVWGRLKRAVARNIGRPADGRYVHVHVHPGFMRVEVDLGVGFQTVVPTGPRSCRVSFRSLTWQSGRGRVVADAAARALVHGSLRTWRRIIAEDLTVLPQVQAGIESPRHPGPGLISRREERIVHFQRWLLDHLEGRASVARTRPVEEVA